MFRYMLNLLFTTNSNSFYLCKRVVRTRAFNMLHDIWEIKSAFGKYITRTVSKDSGNKRILVKVWCIRYFGDRWITCFSSFDIRSVSKFRAPGVAVRVARNERDTVPSVIQQIAVRAFRCAIRGVDGFLLSRFFLFLALVLRELARLEFRNSNSRGNGPVQIVHDRLHTCNTKSVRESIKKPSRKEFRVDRESRSGPLNEESYWQGATSPS